MEEEITDVFVNEDAISVGIDESETNASAESGDPFLSVLELVEGPPGPPGEVPTEISINNLPSDYALESTLIEIRNNQLPDNHNVTVSNIANTPLITGFATADKQLGDNHQVTVSNIENTPLIEGFSTSLKQDTTNTKLDTVISKQLANNHDVNVTNQPTGFATETTLKKLVGFAPGEYDTVDLVFTDTTKLTLQTIVYKKNGSTIATINVAFPDTVTTRFIKS